MGFIAMDDFEHQDRDVDGYTYSHPTNGSDRPDDVVTASDTSDRRLSTDGSPLQDSKVPAPLASVPTARLVAIVCAVVFVLAWLIAGFFSENPENDLDRRLRYQECISQEQARIAREGSLLQPEDFCNLYPGR
ncbi:hypothetical protein [Nocardia anaemiae]|uniref:hypothetical protein n=1 Tax=Nocardia anaemiae TaxID=263910 RepID=UPI000A5EDDC1|nr:hypothetical protein [Nocardia anaemiae]